MKRLIGIGIIYKERKVSVVKKQNSLDNWYALYTAPRAEKKVFQRLSDSGYIVYLPLVTVLRQWADRKKKVVTPLIPSYVFVQIALGKLPEVLSEFGVVGVLREFGAPAIIKAFEIENIKILLKEEDGLELVSENNFSKGVPVRVVKGCFSGIIGEVVACKGKTKIIIRIEAFSQLVVVDIPLSFVEELK